MSTSARNFRTSLVLLAACATLAQAPRPTFEVAVIKRNTSGDDGFSSSRTTPGRVTITNETLRNIIRGAYGRRDLQVLGGPSWIDGDRWDISAAVGGQDKSTSDATRTMMQALLADRFKLVAHTETRETPIYALVMARPDRQPGPQLHASAIECSIQSTNCGSRTSQGMIISTAQTMADTAVNLTQFAGRRVVDKTEMKGRFDFTLVWAPEGGAALTNTVDGGSLFTALQDQLGLKLESERGPVEVVVIDSVQRAMED
jgi:uncharacterized protein (TIGR03435 family)